MKAIVYEKYGPPDVLQLREVEKPIPKDNEVLVKVKAASVNPGDWHALRGTLFYYLLFKSAYVPKALAIFGLIAAPLAFVGELMGLFGIRVPLVVFLPNLPFELTIGVWLLVKGIKDTGYLEITPPKHS